MQQPLKIITNFAKICDLLYSYIYGLPKFSASSKYKYRIYSHI